MFPTAMNWAAANTDFVAIILFTIVAVIICCIVFPQDCSGGDFDFDLGGD